ncbi:MAG: peptidoglycan-binding domain-containing protein [bacterium]|nr:peptidoglycan-binding domain-containing protein [bacterium]
MKISATASTPKLHRTAAAAFEKLRTEVRDGSGIDFLAKLADALRPVNFVSDKDGVANRSWHKTGRAFDYDQTSKALVIVSEIRAGRQFFRTYLGCAKQDGSQGHRRTVADYRGGSVSGSLFDFTAEAESFGFKRIPAWKGWQKHYNRREFWHYQLDEGLSWAQAMKELEGGSGGKVYGLNDRGSVVKQIQRRLYELMLLPVEEVDGVFGAITANAIISFQRSVGVDADGVVGPRTIAALRLK